MTPKELADQLNIPWSENMDHEEVLAEHFRRRGFNKVHLCPDWDFIVIHENSPEFACCTCNKDQLR